MTDSGSRPFDRILAALQERAKELNCLYRIDELLAQREKPLEEIFQGILQAIPAGWQHTASCRGRIAYGGRSWQSADYRETPWRQSSPILVAGRKSPVSLYNPHIATMEADPTKAYNQDDATGFIRLNALRLKVAAKVQKKK